MNRGKSNLISCLIGSTNISIFLHLRINIEIELLRAIRGWECAKFVPTGQPHECKSVHANSCEGTGVESTHIRVRCYFLLVYRSTSANRQGAETYHGEEIIHYSIDILCILCFTVQIWSGYCHRSSVRGVSDSPEGMTPQWLAPKDQMTPHWGKWLPSYFQPRGDINCWTRSSVL